MQCDNWDRDFLDNFCIQCNVGVGCKTTWLETDGGSSCMLDERIGSILWPGEFGLYQCCGKQQLGQKVELAWGTS